MTQMEKITFTGPPHNGPKSTHNGQNATKGPHNDPNTTESHNSMIQKHTKKNKD